MQPASSSTVTAWPLPEWAGFPGLIFLAEGLGAFPAENSTAFAPFSAPSLFGALIATSTGVGGGVVLYLAFTMLHKGGLLAILPDHAAGTSFAIQCCGVSKDRPSWFIISMARCVSDFFPRPHLWLAPSSHQTQSDRRLNS